MSKTRCANTVPTSAAHAPLRSGIFARQHGDPRQLADPARQQGVREQADGEGREDERHARVRWLHRGADDRVPGERARDHREEVQRDRDDDPLPLHGLNALPIVSTLLRLHQNRPTTAASTTSPRNTRRIRLDGSRKKSLCSKSIRRHHRRLPGASPFPARSRDRPSRAAGARRARGRAAVRPRRHGNRRSSRPPADRRARPGRHRARRRLHDLQLPHLRDDGGRGARVGRGPGRRSRRDRRPGALGVARDRRRAPRRLRARAPSRSSTAWVATDGPATSRSPTSGSRP